jgi:hypothetical protein
MTIPFAETYQANRRAAPMLANNEQRAGLSG